MSRATCFGVMCRVKKVVVCDLIIKERLKRFIQEYFPTLFLIAIFQQLAGLTRFSLSGSAITFSALSVS